MQSLEKIEQRAPAVAARIWCLYGNLPVLFYSAHQWPKISNFAPVGKHYAVYRKLALTILMVSTSSITMQSSGGGIELCPPAVGANIIKIMVFFGCHAWYACAWGT